MAFAAARMIKEKEAKQNQGVNHSSKKTFDIIHSHSRSMNLKVTIKPTKGMQVCLVGRVNYF